MVSRLAKLRAYLYSVTFSLPYMATSIHAAPHRSARLAALAALAAACSSTIRSRV